MDFVWYDSLIYVSIEKIKASYPKFSIERLFLKELSLLPLDYLLGVIIGKFIFKRLPDSFTIKSHIG